MRENNSINRSHSIQYVGVPACQKNPPFSWWASIPIHTPFTMWESHYAERGPTFEDHAFYFYNMTDKCLLLTSVAMIFPILEKTLQRWTYWKMICSYTSLYEWFKDSLWPDSHQSYSPTISSFLPGPLVWMHFPGPLRVGGALWLALAIELWTDVRSMTFGRKL